MFLDTKTAPLQRIDHLDFAPECDQCGYWCCHNETPYFSASELEKVGLSTIPTDKGSCRFLKSGRCSIRAQRPLECIIFPFDFELREGEIWWILWNVCPAKSLLKKESSLEFLEKLVREKYGEQYILDYLKFHDESGVSDYPDVTFEWIRPVELT